MVSVLFVPDQGGCGCIGWEGALHWWWSGLKWECIEQCSVRRSGRQRKRGALVGCWDSRPANQGGNSPFRLAEVKLLVLLFAAFPTMAANEGTLHAHLTWRFGLLFPPSVLQIVALYHTYMIRPLVDLGYVSFYVFAFALPMRLHYVNELNQYGSSYVASFMWLRLHYQCTANVICDGNTNTQTELLRNTTIV